MVRAAKGGREGRKDGREEKRKAGRQAGKVERKAGRKAIPKSTGTAPLIHPSSAPIGHLPLFILTLNWQIDFSTRKAPL